MSGQLEFARSVELKNPAHLLDFVLRDPRIQLTDNGLLQLREGYTYTLADDFGLSFALRGEQWKGQITSDIHECLQLFVEDFYRLCHELDISDFIPDDFFLEFQVYPGSTYIKQLQNTGGAFLLGSALAYGVSYWTLFAVAGWLGLTYLGTREEKETRIKKHAEKVRKRASSNQRRSVASPSPSPKTKEAMKQAKIASKRLEEAQKRISANDVSAMYKEIDRIHGETTTGMKKLLQGASLADQIVFDDIERRQHMMGVGEALDRLQNRHNDPPHNSSFYFQGEG